MKLCPDCGEPSDSPSNRCRTCHEELSLYLPTADEITEACKLLRDGLVYPMRQGKRMIALRPRGGVVCLMDAEEKAFRMRECEQPVEVDVFGV